MSPQELELIKLLEKIKSKKITQVEAARLLDLSESQAIRLCQEYKKFERCRHYFKTQRKAQQ